jgi:hypothetical protein
MSDTKEESQEESRAANRGDVGMSRKEGDERESFRRHDQYMDAFGEGSETPIINDPVDGLPRPADDWVAAAPALTEEMICLGKDDFYEEVFREEDVANSFVDSMKLVRCEQAREILKARRSKYGSLGEETKRRKFSKDQVSKRFGLRVATIIGFDKSTFDPEKFVVVAPEREQCRHFAAQIDVATDIQSTTGPVKPLHSYCKAMRSVGGAFLSLMDELVVDCTLREPRDMVSEERIRERIRKKIEQGKERKSVPLVPDMKHEIRFDLGNEFEGTRLSYDCKRSYLPGRSFFVETMSARSFVKAIESKKIGLTSSGHRFLLVGIDKGEFLASYMSADGLGGVHTLMISDADYAPSGLSDEEVQEFLEVWPSHARYPHLAYNLDLTPKFLWDEGSTGGCHTYVVAKCKEDANFGLSLIDMYSGSGKAPVPDNEMRREHVAYLKRKRK